VFCPPFRSGSALLADVRFLILESCHAVKSTRLRGHFGYGIYRHFEVLDYW
jgi:hypothetical protein